MKHFTNFLLIVFAVLIFNDAANSATYYVNAATGSNSNTVAQAKNIATPWATVQYAIDNAAVLNGDNIVVAEGTYPGFTLSKRVNIIGAWKGGSPAVNTIFNSSVNLSAPGGSPSERMVLKNLRIAATSGDAISLNKSYVTLENVFATTTGVNGLRINDFFINDVVIESCNLNNNAYAGIFIPTFANLDGLVMKNTTVNNNGNFGIVAFQTRTSPSEIKNVLISHCAFIDNNPTNLHQGHTIYFEKLKNALFENISVVMPPGNDWIGIDINLLSRTDYSNITIQNSRIIRSSPGSGIWIQARNDLLFPAARLDTVVLKGLTFQNCDTNIAFNRQVKTMTVEKCDLSTYSVYGLVNYTDQDGVIEAAHNKWQGGNTPDTTVISGGLLVSGSPIISFMPSTDGIFIGMCIQGPGIQPGATVVGKSPNTVIMSDTAIANGFIPQIGFGFGCNTSTDIVRTSLNFVHCSNPLQHSIINSSNQSFPDLPSAIAGTPPLGAIYNVPSGVIPGNIVIDQELTLIGPGAGFLHAGSLTSFTDLTVSPATRFFMGSDFAVNGVFTKGFETRIGQNNTLIINGDIAATAGNIIGGISSDMFFGGGGGTTTIPGIIGGLRTLHINRASGINNGAPLGLSRLLFMQTGLLMLENNNLNFDENATTFSPNPSISYVATNGTGHVSKIFQQTGIPSFNFPVGSAGYAPVLLYYSTMATIPGSTAHVRTVDAKHPQNQCPTDYLDRYWVIDQNAMTGTADVKFGYQTTDVVGAEANISGARWDGFGWTVFPPVNTVNHTFTANGISDFGDFTGGKSGCITDLQTQVNIKVYLEGGYIGSGLMRTSMLDNGILPLVQPYGPSQFNYSGTESVPAIPAGVVDWIYLEIRSTATGTAIPSGRRAAFIKADGSVVDLDGTTPVKMTVVEGDYFIVVGHRNHLPVMSTNAQHLSTSSPLYDFATGLSQYYGGQAADLGDGLFACYSGDANKTFVVSAADYSTVTDNLLQTNYNQADLNLTAAVTAADFGFVTRNLLRASNVPGYPPF